MFEEIDTILPQWLHKINKTIIIRVEFFHNNQFTVNNLNISFEKLIYKGV